MQVALPDNPPWWELFSVKEADLHAVCREMVALYKRPRPTYIEVRRQAQPAAAPAPSQQPPSLAQALSPASLASPLAIPGAIVGVANGELADAAAAAGGSGDRTGDAQRASGGAVKVMSQSSCLLRLLILQLGGKQQPVAKHVSAKAVVDLAG